MASRTIKDQVPEIKVNIPVTMKPSTVPAIPNPVLRYNATKALGRGAFNPPEYDLSEIGRIEDTDSYVSEAFGKKISLMFKEGWDIVGPDARVIKYIKARFDQIAQASSVPTRALLRQIGAGLIKKSNCVIVKKRKLSASGGKIRTEPSSSTVLNPVAAYFVAPVETMQYQLSGNKIVMWQQKMPNGDIRYYAPKNIVHCFYRRKDGFVFGTPSLIPVIDDIRALRKIEENIELLIYSSLFPLFHYKVGTETAPAGSDETGKSEVDVVRQEIMYMPTEGSIVTPERHEITAIGSEGRALRAEGYLMHFKKRVFSGLGVSAVDMGEGETANRATADNMSRNLIDSVKDYQQETEIFVNEFIIKELLLESTFGLDILDDNMRCYLKFKEIDVDAQIKKEAHHHDQFVKGALTHSELRTRNGDEPIAVPTRKEVDSETDTAEKYPEWHNTYWKMFEEPKLLIQAMDEPFSAFAKAMARSQSTETTSADIKSAGEDKKKQEVDIEKEKTKAKVAVAKAKPAPKIKNGYIENTFTEVRKDIVKRVTNDKQIDHDWVGTIIRTQMQTTINMLIAEQVLAFKKGYQRYNKTDNTFMKDLNTARRVFTERAETYITRLTEHVVLALRRNVDNDMDLAELAAKTRAVFDSLHYRTEFIEDVEIRKARNYGKVISGRRAGHQFFYTTSSKSACEDCINRHKVLSDMTFVIIEHLPPFHANCNCNLHLGVPVTTTSLTDNESGRDHGAVPTEPTTIDKPHGNDVPKEDYHECPNCGNTALRTRNTANQYNCFSCKYKFTFDKTEDEVKEEVVEEKLKFTECKEKAKLNLSTKHPELGEKVIDQMVDAVCEYLREADNAKTTQGD